MRIAWTPLLLGCHAVQAFDPPPPPGDGARSAIVAFEGDELEVFALELGAEDPLTRPFAADADAIITLLYLPDDLSSMLLSPGRIAPSSGAPERSLPPFLAGYRSQREGELLTWTEIEELSDRAGQFRFAGLDLQDCADAGGCFLDAEHAERTDCKLPCTTAAPAAPIPVETPLEPAFEPCPRGWIASPGAIGCEPSAQLCPAGRYREDLPANAILVDPGQTTLAAAIAGARAGDTIALAKGVHAGNVAIDRPVSILGACAAMTAIDAGLIANADLVLADVDVRGPIAVRAGTSSIARALVRDVDVAGAALIATDLTARGSTIGISLVDATAELSQIAIESSLEAGIAIATSTVSASDVVVRGAFVGVESVSSDLTLIRARLSDLVWEGISIRGAGSFTGMDLSIERVAPPASYAIGLHLTGSSRSAIARFSAAEIDGEGFRASGDAIATIEDAAIRRDGPKPDPLGTLCGFDVLGKARVSGARIHLQDLLRQGLCSNGESIVDVTDVTAIDVGDHALYVFQEGSLKVQRAMLDGAADGVVAFLTTTLDVSDLTVRNMHGDVRYVPTTMLGYPRGRGIYNNAMASVNVERFVVTGCEDAGLDLSSRDSVVLTEGVVTENQIGARITYDPKHLLQKLRVSGNQLNFAAE